MGQQGWKSAQTKANIYPNIDLRGHSRATYLASMGSQHRYDVQRKIKNLTKQFDVMFEQVKSEEERASALQLLIALHYRRRTECGGSDGFHTASHVAFHAESTLHALRRGWLRLSIVRLDGKPASALYGPRYGRTFYFYRSGFDPQYARHSIGLVTMGLAIKSALEEETEEYDLLHGAGTYKFHWA